ncbi:unnamed protein product [Notodromas monacha]|uniref:Uncharacterized protein n=1 Tax=Notodromas monacha TaxID=399045 RepID=A0A7R9GJK5_9CRUS|nr:unnamed protein product [Notodromas monacha]CAG0922914.1 unnamed protein product [Notodromas monacha]
MLPVFTRKETATCLPIRACQSATVVDAESTSTTSAQVSSMPSGAFELEARSKCGRIRGTLELLQLQRMPIMSMSDPQAQIDEMRILAKEEQKRIDRATAEKDNAEKKPTAERDELLIQQGEKHIIDDLMMTYFLSGLRKDISSKFMVVPTNFDHAVELATQIEELRKLVPDTNEYQINALAHDLSLFHVTEDFMPHEHNIQMPQKGMHMSVNPQDYALNADSVDTGGLNPNRTKGSQSPLHLEVAPPFPECSSPANRARARKPGVVLGQTPTGSGEIDPPQQVAEAAVPAQGERKVVNRNS